MTTYPNINRSTLHPGEYVGYGDGTWRISKNHENAGCLTWKAVHQDGRYSAIAASKLGGISNKLQAISDCWVAGGEAFHKGLTVDEIPHFTGRLRQAWINGWNHARDVNREVAERVARNYVVLVHNTVNGVESIDRYVNHCASREDAERWLQDVIDSKSTPQTDWISLCLPEDYDRAIATVNNPQAYRRVKK